jgi:predicted RNA-binding protein with RPS1 domain
VTSLAGYGAFLDIGGVEGLLHVSEIGHARLAHPQEALTVGQELEVQVLKIETDEKKKGGRISLSRKALEADPWQEVAQRFSEGQELTGLVTRAETFGAFVGLAPGIEGLVHISELAHLAKGKRLNHGREAVKLGDEIQVKVLGVDAAKRRISLGIAGVEREAPVISPRPTTRPSERPQPRREGAPSGTGGAGGARSRPEGQAGAKPASGRTAGRPAGKPSGSSDGRRDGRTDRPGGPGGRRDDKPRPRADARGPRPGAQDEGPLVDEGETTKSSPPQGSFGTLGDFFKKKGLG